MGSVDQETRISPSDLMRQKDEFVELDKRLKDEREEAIAALAEVVGTKVRNVMDQVFDGGQFPDEIEHLTYHKFFGNAGYVDRHFTSSTENGYPYVCADQTAQVWVLRDLQVVTLWALGGKAPLPLIEEIMQRVPLLISREDIDFDFSSYVMPETHDSTLYVSLRPTKKSISK